MLTATDLEGSTEFAFWPQPSEERILIRVKVQGTVILNCHESLGDRLVEVKASDRNLWFLPAGHCRD